MNKYYKMLDKILTEGYEQHNKKDDPRYLTDEVMHLEHDRRE